MRIGPLGPLESTAVPDDSPPSPQPQEQPAPEAEDDAARRRLEEREARLAALRRLRERLRDPPAQQEDQ